jgi:3-oxoacyl-[acyl-carrier protein] reductase
MARFDDKVAVVTGAGRGIGAAVSRRLAAEGAIVVLVDRDDDPAQEVAREIGAEGGRAQAIACDVADSAAVAGVFDSAVGSLGRLDILVTCAGILRFNRIENITENEWDEVVDTHLKGTFLCAQAAAPLMVAQKSGKIVLFSSGAAKGFPARAHYSAAKGGIQALCGTLMWELGEHNINVNVIIPGLIDTRMPQQHAQWNNEEYESFKNRVIGQTPLKRVGSPEDCASAVSFLCSDDASFVTGQMLVVSGGL